MLDGTSFRDIVSERRQGLAPSLLRGVLRAAEVPYSLAVGWRNRRYDRGHAMVRGVSVPVISVGNLTLGGTGKTPMVKWLAGWLAARGIRVAIVSRGYGRSRERGAGSGEQGAGSRERGAGSGEQGAGSGERGAGSGERGAGSGEQGAGSRELEGRRGNSGLLLPALNDEAMELQRALPDVPHVQNPDRVAGAQHAIDQFGCQVVLLDDGFQHRRLARDLDIVLLDALEPFGHEHVFPRGTLREPLASLQRAHAVCLSRASAIATHEREEIRRRVAILAPAAAWCEAAHAPIRLVNASGESQRLELLAGKRVAAFCGIGNPAGFRHTLASTGAELVAWREYPDHHAFVERDINELSDYMSRSNAELVLCTQKDLVKLRQDAIAGLPLWAIEIEMRFLAGQDALETLVAGTLRVPSAFAS